MGFIGGGAILKRGDLVTGVTTAATLWVMTVIGLCLGGGQLVLGMVVALLAVATLFALGWLDRQIPREQRALLVIESGLSAALTPGLADSIAPLGYRAQLHKQNRSDDAERMYLWFEISWKQPEAAGPPLDILKAVEQIYPVVSFELTSEARH